VPSETELAAKFQVSRITSKGEVEITAITDISPERREAFSSKFGLINTQQFGDYHDMLKSAQLDAVVICTPHTRHYQQAMDVLGAGLHVLIEKPMTCTSIEGERLVETAEQVGKVLQVSYQRHFQPEFLYIRQTIADGSIGKLTSITASLYQDWKQLTSGSWRQVPELSGGGMLMDSGSHIADVLLWTTGLTPVEVKSQMHQHVTAVEIDSFSSIRFSEGVVAGLNIIGFAPSWYESYVFCGEEGAIFYDNGKITLQHRVKDPIVPVMPAQTTNQDKSFIDSILGRHDIQVPGSFALRVVRLTEMIYQAGGYTPSSI
jgi:predicted dehydrogenase